MGFFSSKNKVNSSAIDWHELIDDSVLEEAKKLSFDKPVLIFKHSTRCPISTMAKHRLESEWDLTDEDIIPYYLDLLRYRSISDLVAKDFDIQHQSPQVLLIKNGACVYTSSHSEIDIRSLKKEL